MYEKLLIDSGLTVNEAKVYETLLKLGKAQSGKIVRESGISGGKIYETLYKLADKGLVEEVTENGVKQFFTSDPKSLLLYMEDEKNKIINQTDQLAKVVPDLSKLRNLSCEEENVYLIKGLKGIRPIVFDAVDKQKGVAKIMGVRSTKNNIYNIFWKQWHNHRVSLKKQAMILFSDRNTEYWKFFSKLKYTKIKSISRVSPSAIMIIDDNSFILSYEGGFTCIHIVSETIAKSFSTSFDTMWDIGKE